MKAFLWSLHVFPGVSLTCRQATSLGKWLELLHGVPSPTLNKAISVLCETCCTFYFTVFSSVLLLQTQLSFRAKRKMADIPLCPPNECLYFSICTVGMDSQSRGGAIHIFVWRHIRIFSPCLCAVGGSGHAAAIFVLVSGWTKVNNMMTDNSVKKRCVTLLHHQAVSVFPSTAVLSLLT